MKIMDFIKSMSNRTNYEKNNRNQQTVEAMDLYKKLSTEVYNQYPCQTEDLGDGMSIVKQVIGEYWKPRYLMDNNVKVAFEFMDETERLKTIRKEDIDWGTTDKVPEKVRECAQNLSGHFPTFVGKYDKGVAEVSWQINPDGRYYMDDDGFGMTWDEEITLYGYIDRLGNTLVKFRIIKDFDELKEMKQEARKILDDIHFI